MKRKSIIRLGIILILFVILYYLFSRVLLLGSPTIGSLDLFKVVPSSFLDENFDPVLPSNNQQRDSFYILIPPDQLPGYITPTMFDQKNPDGIFTVGISELPFFNKQSLILNIQYYDRYDVLVQNSHKYKQIEVKILDQEIGKFSHENSDGKEYPFYRVKIEIPNNIESNVWEAIRRGLFDVSNKAQFISIVIPASFIIRDVDSNEQVCIVINRKEILSMDYQHYRVKGKLRPIHTLNSNPIKTQGRFSYYEDFLVVDSGLNQNEEITKVVASECQ